MTKAVFDVLNIEYQYENDDDTDYWPYTMTVSVEHDENKHFSFTEDAIRAELESYITLQQGEPVKVVDLTAFYTGTKDPLRGNYEDYEAETFEAREKKIGSIRIVKNPNFPSGTSLQAYIKTNRAELRKVFGNPNMGESGDGKSKGKEWNLVVGGKRVTIYDRREMDKKGTKYFNIGGDGKYGALLVAQALSIHRNERVYAKETVPQWLEDRRQYQQVKSIDEHPDLTYERAKEYEDNRRRYGAESDAFGEYTLPLVGGQRERLEDKVASQLVMLQRVALNKGNDDYLHDIFKDGYGKPLRKMTDAELLRKNKEVEMDIDSIYGAENYEDSWEKGVIRLAISSGCFSDDYAEWVLRQIDGPSATLNNSRFKEIIDKRWGLDAETFDVEFNEWAEQEMMSHGKDISFKDWAEDEGMKHGNVPITEWAEHEEESHDARYGAEEGDDCPNCHCEHQNLSLDGTPDVDEEYVSVNVICDDCGIKGYTTTYPYEWDNEAKLRYSPQIAVNMHNPVYGDLKCSRCHERFQMAAENWGGNPKGQLALALQKARENAKKPKKPLKIEKLDAEEGGFYQLEVKYKMEDGWEHHSDYDNEEDATGAYYDIYLKYPEVILLEVDSDGEGDVLYRQRNHDIQSAETSGQWEIGEQLEEAQMNAEGKKRKKLSGQLSDPFDELSLDSGGWKSIAIGFGVATLTLFGLTKVRK